MSWILLASAPWLGLASLSARWGAMASRERGRPAAEGFLLGLALGPAGYLIAESLPKHVDDGDGHAEEWSVARSPHLCCEDEMRRSEAMSEAERACHEWARVNRSASGAAW